MKKYVLIIPSILLYIGMAFSHTVEFHAEFNKILNKHVFEGAVDYASLKYNRFQLDAYLTTLAGVDKVTFYSWSRDAQLAYVINLYNAATLQLIINNYPVKSIKNIGSIFKGPWDQPVVMLFGKKITLNNLEHDIIRKEYNEPRIHMVLVCAAKGCPPLRSEAYVAERLNEQLNYQSKLYLTSSKGIRIDKDKGRVYLSAIFKWYGNDFPSVSAFVEKHSGKSLAGLDVRWIDYDWSLND